MKNLLQHKLATVLCNVSVLEKSIGFTELQATEGNSSLEWTIAKYEVRGCKRKKKKT
jgi:hypothetical protein